jgi:DNA-binding response OmpR family regulator
MPADSLLIVDDEPNVRTSLPEHFEREGFQVSVAADGTILAVEEAPVFQVKLPMIVGGGKR